ncbi:MAG TPA: AccI family restriction endonuclease [Candidatus Cloacimonadota bacterium]|nr:AccI family restriction endonuclease [Candidatus Cloacimonadota bacterium]
MAYIDDITEITTRIPRAIIDFETERVRARIPSQSASNFITNKEQGDWAERIVFDAINNSSQQYKAVKYGKSDDIIAGEDGFDAFYNDFQEELDKIGKRPDILIFNINDYREDFGLDISRMSEPAVREYVKQAIAGVEIRSSTFLLERYEAYMNARTERHLNEALEIVSIILSDYLDLLQHEAKRKYIGILQSINTETIRAISFRVPGWGANERLIELNQLFKDLQYHIKEIQKRSTLSITPKVEDIRVVYKWIETYNVPHYYFQVFFDKVYAISFKEILLMLTDADNEGRLFNLERDSANQFKTTIKISTTTTQKIADRVDEPDHSSRRRELNKGQLLYYVTFQNGCAYLDIEALKNVLNIPIW